MTIPDVKQQRKQPRQTYMAQQLSKPAATATAECSMHETVLDTHM